MRTLSTLLIILAAAASLVGGISRLILVPLIAESRVYAGVAAILLLFAIALNTLGKKT